ncbi:MAG: phosphomannomutase/phosphoglucomutase [Deferribacterales bacterium]
MLRSKDIFRRYDIRGVYGDKLTDELAELSAKGFASMVIAETGKSAPTLSLGRDVRFSSKALADAVCRGLTDSGVNVIDLGVCPSPLTYFSMYSEDTDGYVMITGSHNPPEFNGIKVGTKNTVYHSEKIEQIYTNIIDKNFPSAVSKGKVTQTEIIPKYIAFMDEHFTKLKMTIAALPSKIRVVIDAGSGTAGSIAPAVFRNLGTEVSELYCTPDGSFPGHHPDPTVEKNMAEARNILLAKGADIAVGFDGDADRLGALNSKGDMIWGDQLIGIFAEDVSAELRGEKVVADVKASKGLYEHLENIGMKSVMYLSGHSMIKEKMKQEKAVIGGEMSSHFFFADRYYGYDDGIYAAVRLLEAYVNKLKDGRIKCSAELTDGIPKYINTPEIREACPDEIKFEIVEKMKTRFTCYLNENNYGITDLVTIDGIRVTFEKGWALIRASNTEPLLVTRFEAATAADMEDIRRFITNELKETLNDIQKKN